MKITGISPQLQDQNRVNISVDGKYRFSLDIYQLGELGIKVGREYSEDELALVEAESQFGKLYARSLEYSMVRPRSVKEMRDYLWRKTLTKKVRSRSTGEVYDRPGVSQLIADRVLERLIEKKYVDDRRFAEFWVENRFARKGISQSRLKWELGSKGISQEVIDEALAAGHRDEAEELQKIIARKQSRYPDRDKLVKYLMSQGFSYDAVARAVSEG